MESGNRDPKRSDIESTVVNVDWLSKNLSKKNLKVLDATWGLGKTDSEQNFEQSHIPGAQFFDIDKIADKSVNLPHMLPSESDFEFAAANFGIGNDDHVVVYDRSGIYVASARVWWTFRCFGHNRVSVLEGGLSNWIKGGYNVESGPARRHEPSAYRARLNKNLVQYFNQMKENIKGKQQIVDARSSGRFNGTEPEPRVGLRGGHMPGSKNLPFGDILIKKDPKDEFLSFLQSDQLSQAFNKAGIDPSKPVVTTCGSGVTASVLALGLHLLGNKNFSVYDGSWSEWGSLSEDIAPVIGKNSSKT